MNRGELLQLQGEKTALERMLGETPEDDVLDRASLAGRLQAVEESILLAQPSGTAPARVRLTFKGRPVVGSHGIFAEFGMRAVSGFTESVTAMAASLTAPLAAMGPIPNRDQHQLLITSTALGSFGFELEEHLSDQLTMDDTTATAVAHALDQTQLLLRGTLGTDDELADSASDVDRRALDKMRSFLTTLADNEATCTVQYGDNIVSFTDVGQVRNSIERLSQENFREEYEELAGEIQGVLPKGRVFEFKLASTSQVIRGKVAPAIANPDILNSELHRLVRIRVHVTRVGGGKPRYLLVSPPEELQSAGV
jgi:hypothetical protein